MKTSDSITNIIKAIAKAKSEMRKPSKDGINPHFKSKYTTLDELLSCVEPALCANGLVMFPRLLNGEGTVGCQITIYHTSGEWMAAEAFFLPAQGTAQGHGSASTYVSRYAISALFSIAADDDDANLAMQPKMAKTKAPVTDEGASRTRAIEMIKAKCTDEELKTMIKTKFDKPLIDFLTLEELRKLYKLIEKVS